MRGRDIVDSVRHALFPSMCSVCGDVLVGNERAICLDCLAHLPYISLSTHRDNMLYGRMAGLVNIENAMASFEYKRQSNIRKVVHEIKFHGNYVLAHIMGRQMGLDLINSSLFDDVDVLVPVPLHFFRRLKRGYNQSEQLCRGLVGVYNRPIDTHSLIRHRYTRKQSLQRHEKRSDNVANAFHVRNYDALANRHVLLVDDVVTTGATLSACCQELEKVPGIRISIAALCVVP